MLCDCKEADIPDQNGEISFEEPEVRSECRHPIVFESSNIMHFTPRHLPNLDGIEWKCDDVDEGGEDAGGYDFMDDLWLLLDLRDCGSSLVEMMVPHDVGFLEELYVGWIVLHSNLIN